MSVSNRARSVSTAFVERVVPMTSPKVREVVTLGRRQGWNCAVLGQAPLPIESVRLGDWLIVPAHQDTSPVPARTLERVQAIFTAGLRPRGFVVVHEAPKLLPAPAQSQPDPLQMFALPPRLRSALKTVGTTLAVLAGLVVVATGLAVAAAAVLSLAAVLILPALIVGAVVVDPILVVVTEDGYWIEIDRWWN